MIEDHVQQKGVCKKKMHKSVIWSKKFNLFFTVLQDILEIRDFVKNQVNLFFLP